MLSLRAIVFCCSVGAVFCSHLTFPPGFKLGAATASYQVEGGWNASDKSENIWDVLTHTKPHIIRDRSNGDIACDSYNQWQRDVDLAADMGLDFYRFSLSWSRLLPSGFPDKISDDGAKYYNSLINALLDKGIEPLITIFHWDLPQSLQDLGGWTNPLISDWFADYARVAFSLFGDRVKLWVTINEATSICDLGYGLGILAPAVKSPDYGNYICAKNTQLAHAKAWRVYDKEFRSKFNGNEPWKKYLSKIIRNCRGQEDRISSKSSVVCSIQFDQNFYGNEPWKKYLSKIIRNCRGQEDRISFKSSVVCSIHFDQNFYGKVGITNHLMWMEPASDEDEEITDLARQLASGLYCHPILSKKGGWPAVLEKKIAEYSKNQGYTRSRLPSFTEEEIKLVKGTYDFLGVNHYTSRIVSKLQEGEPATWPLSGSPVLGVKLSVHPDWKPTVAHWLYEYPEGFRRQLQWVKKQYGDIQIIITENGYPTQGMHLEDHDRINYYNKYLEQVLLAIKVDGVNVIGYAAWSLIDNFEWLGGYITNFGLNHVAFDDPARTVTPRLSAKFYANVIKNRSLNVTRQYISDEL